MHLVTFLDLVGPLLRKLAGKVARKLIAGSASPSSLRFGRLGTKPWARKGRFGRQRVRCRKTPPAWEQGHEIALGPCRKKRVLEPIRNNEFRDLAPKQEVSFCTELVDGQ